MSIMSYIVNFQTTPEKYMEAYFQKLIPSMLDKVVMLTIILPTFIVNLICLAKFKSLAVGLSEFQDFINSKRVFGVNAVKNETSRWALITFLLFVSASIIVRLGNYYLMNTLLQLSHFWVITLSMVESTLTLSNAPIWYFAFIYYELYNVLSMWANMILHEHFQDIMKNVKDFLEGLQMVQSIVSTFLFWIISAMVVQLTILSYFIFASMINEGGENSVGWQVILVLTGISLMISFFIYNLYVFCTISEKIISQVQAMKTKVMNLELQTLESSLVYSALGEFQGFDANGYFVLNHSLLTGITANVTTYLVILIQFKQSGI